MYENLTILETTELNKIAKKVQENNELEARSIEGYTELLNLIEETAYTLTNEPNSGIIKEYLTELQEATREKIADELNHSHSLNAEFAELTGIKEKGE